MKYRPEIDGLRSLAVIPVVLFHAGLDVFSGGFIGVDIFFVISGYLIAKIIISEIENSSFTYLGFYERRIRRIFPALAVVTLVCLLATFSFGLPEHVIQTSNSGLFALIGLSNFYFWSQSGYFSPASEYQILLHTWSLGVEEQFYLLLPPIIFLIYKFRLRLIPVIAVGLPILFLISLWLSQNKPSVAFYLLPARAWELSIGVALACGVIPKSGSTKFNELIAITGLFMVISSVFLINKQMQFPGWVALLPCVGAAAIIYASNNTGLASSILSLPPLRFVGLISYSLYLWHWPVFVGLRMYTAEPHLSPLIASIGITISFILAVLTWHYVEKPFRSISRMSFRRVLVGTSSIGAVSILVAIIGISGSGLPSRLSENTQQFLSATQDIDPLREHCEGIHPLSQHACQFGAPETPIDFVLLGDSHAGAIRSAIEKWAISSGRAGTLLWLRGCPMLLGATKVPDFRSVECTEFKKAVYKAIEATPSIKTVFIAGRWEQAYTGIAPEIGGSFRTYWIDNTHSEHTPDVSIRVFENALERTSRTFEKLGAEVIFVGAVPETGFDVPRVLALASHNQHSSQADIVIRDSEIKSTLDSVFQRITETSMNSHYISIWRNFCDPNCVITRNGIPLYSDDDHLTLTAARDFLGPILTQEIVRSARRVH
ncbi:MAG: acyltransferase [Gammaproteobacteria bacterium]|nr:acyltransferase [Gammaproteobacteria bacterium]